MKERVLITGASGFVGNSVLRYLYSKTGWDFVALCSWEHKGSPLRMQDFKDDPRVDIIHHDITKILPDMGHFDYVINMASESHVDRSIEDPVNFIKNNVDLVLNMLEYARKHPPKLFIQFSTDEVYGATEHGELDIYDATNPYSGSKASQEIFGGVYKVTYDVNVVITNSNNIIGPGQDPEKFVPKVLKRINAGETIQIHTANGVPGRRYWNPVDNVADALLFLINNLGEYDFDRAPHFALPGGKELDNLEMAQLIAKLAGKELKYELVDATTIRPHYDENYPHTDGKITDMGWTPPYTLEEGLQWLK